MPKENGQIHVSAFAVLVCILVLVVIVLFLIRRTRKDKNTLVVVSEENPASPIPLKLDSRAEDAVATTSMRVKALLYPEQGRQ